VKPIVILSGGEPLMRIDLREIIEYIAIEHKDIKICLLTNGVLIDSSVAANLKKYNIHVQISFDGPDAITHDYFRGTGVFDKAEKGVGELRSHKVPFCFQAVLQKHNCEFIPGFFAFAKRSGASSMDFTRYLPISRESDRKNTEMKNMLSGQELKRAYENIYKASQKYGVRTSTNHPLWCLIDRNLGHPSSAGYLGLTIAPDGKIQLTSRINEPIGDVKRKNGLNKVYFDNEILRELRMGKIAGCRKCEHFSRCRGDRNISYVLSNNFLEPDEHCWHWQEYVNIEH
jgi:MoaA/NifB/PqqE/SkfB family radical SAM enzyme